MSYTALYRKWRPDNFDDVKGQDAIVKTLRNQIKANRIGHAYLFCGTRGTGKTSVAKIMAKAVNCENPVEGNPCGQCASCRDIASGSSMNVIEIDAASNNGVDNIREIRENVAYSPTNAKYKVYIVDEVHMLSSGAFNALLKTLEEPPSYVIFILATTESHKIPVTILSRCQRYDFKRIPMDVLSGRLQEIMDNEGIQAEERAVRYIAKTAEGGMRDAISLLDQCVAFYLGKEITYENALEVFGAVDTGVFSTFLRAISAESVVDAVHVIDKIIFQGRDITQFVVDFTWYLRNVLLVKSSRDAEEVVDINAENMKLLKEEAKALEVDRIIRYIRVFSELSNNMRYAAQKRVLLEIAVVKLCRPQMETDISSVLERIRVVEDMIKSGDFSGAAGIGALSPEDIQKKEQSLANEKKAEQEVIEKLPKATQDDLGKIAGMWKDIVRRISDPYKSCLREARVSVRPADCKLVIVLKNRTEMVLTEGEDCNTQISQALATIVGKDVDYELEAQTDIDAKGVVYPEVKNMFGMPIEVNDEEF